mmetsp:Transcript_33894/g.86894  ORF Transcript_33894/g.86894 Transcript_33894/m.86894 type:complete len:360 (+) Transcript_33894:316-1395(+)
MRGCSLAATHRRGATVDVILGRLRVRWRTVDRRRDPQVSGLQLQGEVLGEVAREAEVAALHPEPLLRGRLPHIAELTLPRTRVIPRVGAQAPDLAQLVRHVLADEPLHDIVERAISCGKHDDIGLQLGSVPQQHLVLREASHVTMRELHVTIHDQLRGTCVKVVAVATAQELHEVGRVILTEVQAEANCLQPPVVLGILLADLLAPLLLLRSHDLEGDGDELQVGLVCGDALGDRVVVAGTEDCLELCAKGGDHARTPLDHGDLSAMLPEVLRDVVRRCVGANDNCALACVLLAVLVFAGVEDFTLELLAPLQLRHPGASVEARREDEVFRPQLDLGAVAVDLDRPLLASVVPRGGDAG